MTKKLFWFVFTVFLFPACGEEEDVPAVLLPSALEVTVTQGSGRTVDVTAKAENANFYHIYFGEGTQSAPVKTTTGKASHTYAADGTYTLRVQAHATDRDFISETREVTLEIVDEIVVPAEGYVTPDAYAGMKLIWQDEFEGDVLNSDFWTHETGTGQHGWGNNELQYYRSDNTTLHDGCLVITAREESHQGSEYTSSRIITQDKFEFQYGRVDIRAALPKGQGIWPALWMLGANFSDAGWPACGEVDIMEMIGGGGREKTVHGTVHWESNGHASYGQSHSLPTGTYADAFHVFSIVWDAETIRWYVDDVEFNVIDITPADLSAFHQPFFLIFNVAVGGNWPGDPNTSTVFPQRMIVDYVRVFQSG